MMIPITVLIFIIIPFLAAALPSIYIASPAAASSFLLAPGENSQTVPLQLQLFGVVPGYTCISYSSNSDTHSISLKQVQPGQYQLRAVLKGADGATHPESEIVNYFTMISYEDAVPLLQLGAVGSAGPISLAADPSTHTSTLRLDYALQARAIDTTGFTICVNLINKGSGKQVLDWACLSPQDRSFSLSSLPLGLYLLSIVLRDARPSLDARTSAVYNDLLSRQALLQEVSVLPLSALWPSLQLPHRHLDYALDSGKQTTTTVVSYSIQGSASAMQLSQVCLRLSMLHCQPSTSSSISLSMPAGRYNATLGLYSLDGKHMGPQEGLWLEIQEQQEFLASYIWQPLRAWHSIPSGLETRLPLDGIHQKEARIPQPWRLQLAMPAPCKYFLRFDVHPADPLQAVLDAAGEKCKQSPSCFMLLLDGAAAMDAQATVQEADLFNRVKELHFSPSCSS